MTPSLPVPLTDRLPSADDFNTDGLCWFASLEGETVLWGLQSEPTFADSHWLPWHSLPTVA